MGLNPDFFKYWSD